MHADDFRFTHEFDVGDLFLAHLSSRCLAQELVAAFSELLNFFGVVECLALGLQFKLKCVFTSQILEVFLVLDADLL